MRRREVRGIRPGRREGVRCGGVHTGRACAERTSNMPPMSVTLDVSRLSGWLNADASCPVERGGACDATQGRGTLEHYWQIY